jgi:chemotaxis protein methyltransferase CheR
MITGLTPNTPHPAETSELVGRLMAMLRDFAGFRASSQIQRKLERIFGNPDDLVQFLHAVAQDPARTELTALVEDLTNHETYFFRERAHLDALAEVILPRLIAEKKAAPGLRRLTLWSAACATGEEAYTLTMIALRALITHGVAHEKPSGEIVLPPDWKLDVLGTDISRQAVRIARDARYTMRKECLSSFRQFPEEYFCFFDEMTPPLQTQGDRKTYKVKDTITRFTRFEQFNLMNQNHPCKNADVIFCRNVLIYMDAESQKRIIRSLHQALRADGTLLLSLVDAMTVPQLFRENRQSRCVIYEKP